MTLWPPTAQGWKAIAGVVVLIAIIVLILFTMDKCGGYWSNRNIDKLKANVNAALADVNNAKGTVSNDKVDEAVALEKVKQAANDVITASNATDQAKTEANQAVANYIAAKNANRPTGTTEAQLDEALRKLDQ